MDREFAQFDSLESALREAGEAERAGVFSRTRLDARTLLRQPVSTGSVRPIWLRRLGSIAAVLVVATGVWGWMFVDQIGKIRDRANPIVARPTILAHLTGPAIASTESTNDFDADGDLDLADYRSFQLQFGVTR